MKTLLVYTVIPSNEEEIYFIIPDEEILPEWKDMLKQAHMHTINVHDMNEGMLWLASATATKEEYCSPHVEKKYHCCLNKYRVNKENYSFYKDGFEGPFSMVYLSGYYL